MINTYIKLLLTTIVFTAALLMSPSVSAINIRGSAPGNPYKDRCYSNRFGGIVYARGAGTATEREKARKKVFGAAWQNGEKRPSKFKDVNFLGQKVPVHKRVRPCLLAARYDIQNYNKNHSSKSRYKVSVAYGAAPLGGENTITRFHPYGAALDINPKDNPFYHNCKDKCKYKMKPYFVRSFQRYGFGWGGDYGDSKDYMHFEWYGKSFGA